jgi:hypothetical protein
VEGYQPYGVEAWDQNDGAPCVIGTSSRREVARERYYAATNE